MDDERREKEPFPEDKGTYISEGIVFGMLAGVVSSSIFGWNMGMAISYGMLFGLVFGMLIKKK